MGYRFPGGIQFWSTNFLRWYIFWGYKFHLTIFQQLGVHISRVQISCRGTCNFSLILWCTYFGVHILRRSDTLTDLHGIKGSLSSLCSVCILSSHAKSASYKLKYTSSEPLSSKLCQLVGALKMSCFTGSSSLPSPQTRLGALSPESLVSLYMTLGASR